MSEQRMCVTEVRTSHRGFDVRVWREKCVAGYPLTFYSIFRETDQREMDSGYTEATDSPKYLHECFLNRVDEFLNSGATDDEF